MAGLNFAHSELVLLNTIQSLFDQANLSLCGSCGSKSFPGYTICPEPDCEALLPAASFGSGHLQLCAVLSTNPRSASQDRRHLRQAIRYVVRIENAHPGGVQTPETLMDPDDLIALFNLHLLLSDRGAGEE
ncbi:hypothetical protein FPHYL_12055 [Fusarium phyllophilum]|uniref:Uncharacterized protein n=1 Tax=Fusarium phyllophilum TaxID=47803 RepID=A0A8H5ITJ9_9HYPO|nr:hypothetical protein FPHYL_12055 [Fusarium phyllophilum]